MSLNTIGIAILFLFVGVVAGGFLIALAQSWTDDATERERREWQAVAWALATDLAENSRTQDALGFISSALRRVQARRAQAKGGVR